MARRTNTDIVRRTLEKEIFTGVLAPGAALDEEKLAQRFSVSRTPIREAILQLLQNGLIEKESRKSARVVKLDLHRLIQVFEATSELESLCAKLAARRITEKELEELQQTHRLTEKAYRDNQEDDYASLGREFHFLVMKAAHNEVLLEATNKIALQTRPYRRFQLKQQGRMQANLRDHSDILEAIEKRDEKAAQRLMLDHVMIQGSVLAEYISMNLHTFAEAQ